MRLLVTGATGFTGSRLVLLLLKNGYQVRCLHPTMIYGSARDRNMWRLIRFMLYSPIVPIFGDGNSLQQPIVALMKFLESLRLPLPIKADQVLRLNENKAFDYTQAASDFGFAPLSFDQGIKMELGTSQGNEKQS